MSEISKALYEQPIEGEMEWLIMESKYEEVKRFYAYPVGVVGRRQRAWKTLSFADHFG